MRQHLHPLAKVMVIAAPGFVTDRHPAKADGFTRPPFAHLVVIYQMRGVERRDGRIRLDLQRWVELHRTRPVASIVTSDVGHIVHATIMQIRTSTCPGLP